MHGLDLLHHEVFRTLVQNGLEDDLFRIKSPFLQAFIENEMWRFEHFEQNDRALSPVQKRALQFQSVLNATCKHFLSI